MVLKTFNLVSLSINCTNIYFYYLRSGKLYYIKYGEKIRMCSGNPGNTAIYVVTEYINMTVLHM